MSYDITALAALAEVAKPAAADSPGGLVLSRVADQILSDIAELGHPNIHVACIAGAADEAVPLDEAEAFAAFVDLALWAEGLPTALALEQVGRRLGVALVAQATWG
jgi:hypothetical protein